MQKKCRSNCFVKRQTVQDHHSCIQQALEWCYIVHVLFQVLPCNLVLTDRWLIHLFLKCHFIGVLASWIQKDRKLMWLLSLSLWWVTVIMRRLRDVRNTCVFSGFKWDSRPLVTQNEFTGIVSIAAVFVTQCSYVSLLTVCFAWLWCKEYNVLLSFQSGWVVQTAFFLSENAQIRHLNCWT